MVAVDPALSHRVVMPPPRMHERVLLEVGRHVRGNVGGTVIAE